MRSAVGWRSCKLCNLVPTTLPTGQKPQQWKQGVTSLSSGVANAMLSPMETGSREELWGTAFLKCAAAPSVDVKETNVYPEAPDGCPKQHRIKKKIAFWVGYVGTEYKGLQLQRSPGIPTVEAELEKAILKADGMLGTNFGNLHRLGWARSSRTDKGVGSADCNCFTVHSISTVISMKMEVPEGAWVHDEDGVALAESINSHLPPTIRVFSVVPVPKSFDARKMCYTRTYQYLLPAGVLFQGSCSGAAAEGQIAELNSILSEFQGRHPFHNYTVRSRYQNVDKKPVYLSRVSAYQLADGGTTQSPDDVVSDLTAEDELPLGIDEDSLDPSSVVEQEGDIDDSTEPALVKARWMFEPDAKDKVRTSHFRHILSCSCHSELESCGGARFLRISITGESFMLHQIRKMVGTSVAVLWGVLPRDVIALSLARHSRIVLPLAPSEGLILVDNRFHNFKLPGSYARSSLTTQTADKEPRLEPSVQVTNQMQSFSGNVLLPSMAPLLDHAGAVWATWIQNVTTQAQIPDVQLKAAEEAFARWLLECAVNKEKRELDLTAAEANVPLVQTTT